MHRRSEARQEAEDLVALMTPIVKALFHRCRLRGDNHGMQMFGGHGYIREMAWSNIVRDARITQIYEGTNGIQALDLVGRKLPAHAGRFCGASSIRSRNGRNHEDDVAGALRPAAGQGVRPAAAGDGEPRAPGLARSDRGGGGATDICACSAWSRGPGLGARAAEVSWLLAEGDAFYRAKLATAEFY